MSNQYIPQLPMLSSGLPNALEAANSYRDALLTTHQTVQIANEIAHLRSKDAPIRALAAQIVGNIDDAKKDIPFRIAAWIRDNVKYTQETPMVEILQGPYRTLGGKISVDTPMGKFRFNGTGTGDCDDLSILFATLCRSLGIEAFLIGIAKQDNPDNFFHAMGYCDGVFYELSKDAPYGGVGGAVIASTHPFDNITGLLFNPVTGKQKRVYLMKAKQKGNNMSGSHYSTMHGGDCSCGAMGGPNCNCQARHMNGSGPDCGCDDHYDCGCGDHHGTHMGASGAPAAEKPAGPAWLHRPIGTPAYVGEPVDSLQPRYTVPLNLYAPSRQISGISMNGSRANSRGNFGVGEGLGSNIRPITGRGGMHGAILTDSQMPQPTVYPHNVMQGSILTDSQMPQPTVYPHNVMQGTTHFSYGQPAPGQAFFEYGKGASGYLEYGKPAPGQTFFQYGKGASGYLEYGKSPTGEQYWSYADPDAGMGATSSNTLNLKYNQVIVDANAQRNGTIYVNGLKTQAGFVNGNPKDALITLPLYSGANYILVVVYDSKAKSLPLTISIPKLSGPSLAQNAALAMLKAKLSSSTLKFELDVKSIAASLTPRAVAVRPTAVPSWATPVANRVSTPPRPTAVPSWATPVANRPSAPQRPPAPPVGTLIAHPGYKAPVPPMYKKEENPRKKPLAHGNHSIGVAKVAFKQIVSEPRVQWDGDIYLNGKFTGSAIRSNRPAGAPLKLVKGANILIVKYRSGAISLPVSVILNDTTLKAIKAGKFAPIKFQLDPHSVKPSMLKGPALKPPPTPPVGSPPISCSPPTPMPPGMPPASQWDDRPVDFLSGKYDAVGQLPGMNAPVIAYDAAGRILVNATNIIPFIASNLKGVKLSACAPQADGKIWVYFDSVGFKINRPEGAPREELIAFDCGTPTGYAADIESKLATYPLDANKWPAEALAQFKQDATTYQRGVDRDVRDLSWAGYKNPTLAYLMVAQACAMMAAKQVVDGVLVTPVAPGTPVTVPVEVKEQVQAHDIAEVAIAKTAEIAATTNQTTSESTPVAEVEKVEAKVEEVKDNAEANNVAPEVAEKKAEEVAVEAPKDAKEAAEAAKEEGAAPEEKKGKGGLIMLLAAATGVYFLTKG